MVVVRRFDRLPTLKGSLIKSAALITSFCLFIALCSARTFAEVSFNFPAPFQQFSRTADVAGNGNCDGPRHYFIYELQQRNARGDWVTKQSVDGNSSAMTPSMWSATLPNPSGGWTPNVDTKVVIHDYTANPSQHKERTININ